MNPVFIGQLILSVWTQVCSMMTIHSIHLQGSKQRLYYRYSRITWYWERR